MSSAERINHQIFGIITESDLAHRQLPGFLEVLAPGLEDQDQSTVVKVKAIEGDPFICVAFAGQVLGEIPSDPEVQPQIYLRINQLNQGQRFGRWVYYPEEGDQGMVILEHELLGNTLDKDELMMAVVSLGQLADEMDNILQEEFGFGRRLHDYGDLSEHLKDD